MLLIHRDHGFLQVAEHAIELLIPPSFEPGYADQFDRVVKTLADAAQRVGQQRPQTGFLRQFHHQA